MIALVEGASQAENPNEVALDILIAGLTMILLVGRGHPPADGDLRQVRSSPRPPRRAVRFLAPTTIGGLLVGDRHRLDGPRHGAAKRAGDVGRAVEAAGDCSTLLLDKTGTITTATGWPRSSSRCEAWPRRARRGRAASSTADETPEGRSIVDFARDPLRSRDPTSPGATRPVHRPDQDERRRPGRPRQVAQITQGAADSVRLWVRRTGDVPPGLAPVVERIASTGGTPLVVADGPRVLGVSSPR